ncbi:MAG: hypothetical protein ABJC63_01965 [Gemmatimonadales bacterium]
MADRWLIEYGPSGEKMTIVGKAGTRADAASTAQTHFDTHPHEPAMERMVFPADNPAGEYCCGGGFYRITRLGSGHWKAIVD